MPSTARNDEAPTTHKDEAPTTHDDKRPTTHDDKDKNKYVCCYGFRI